MGMLIDFIGALVLIAVLFVGLRYIVKQVGDYVEYVKSKKGD